MITWLDSFRRYLVLVTVANFVWEIAHLPLYTIWTEGSAGQIVFAVLHCTGGDVLIASTSLLGALLLMGHPGWPADRYWPTAALAVAAGLTYTMYSEWLNTEIRGSWTYRSLMPTLPWVGTGATPFAQWLVVPAGAFVWLARANSAHRSASGRQARS